MIKKITLLTTLMIFSSQLSATVPLSINNGKTKTSISSGIGFTNVEVTDSNEFSYYLDFTWMKSYKNTAHYFGGGIGYTNSQDHYTNFGAEIKYGYDWNVDFKIPITSKFGLGYAYNEIENIESNGFQYSLDTTWDFSKKYSFGYKIQINEVEINSKTSHNTSNLFYFSANF